MMKKTAAAVAILVLAGCGGDSGSSSSGGGVKSVNVVWSLDPINGPTCRNTEDITRFNGSFAQSIDCIWKCANYKGQRGVYVDIGFERRNQSGAVWKFDTEYVSSGICF